MTLYECSMHGVQPSGRSWSSRVRFVSSASLAAVEADWLAQVDSFWLNGTHGLETLFPAGTTIGTVRTAQLTVVPITTPTGTVDKIRTVATRQDDPALVGTAAGAALPDQNCILVNLRTGDPGVLGRGKLRLPAPDETLVTAGELGSTPATRVSTATQALQTGMAAAGHSMVVVNADKTKAALPVGTARTVTFIQTDRVIRTVRQRVRRRVGVFV
jgi:hypothetical protein